MDSIKSKIFIYLSSAQKSEFCHYVATFTKKNHDKSFDNIADLLIEEEKYYLEIDSSRHPWIEEFLEEETLFKDLILFIKDVQRKLLYKEQQKPFLEKQKVYMKEQRKFLRDQKMSKTPPTQKQVAYFKSLCKKYGIDTQIINPENASRLDYKNALNILLDKEALTDKENIILKLKSLII
jgi:hypothetical protein